jgi:lipopolysaccharide biosynthesis protein
MDSSPELFREHVKSVINALESKPQEERIAFIKSWNEWGEGNYMEPDLIYGNQYLEVLLNEITESTIN